jgi:hypothetical protein
MDAMAIKRHTLHLDTQDLKALTKLARQETRATGVYISAAGIIRRMIKEYLRAQAEEKPSR